MQVLMQHVSEFGSEHAFPEEAFANKKVMPGFVPRAAGDKVWSRRRTVSPEGPNSEDTKVAAQPQS
eukprot:11756027-Alexandrium_andersonii.AAC.1